MVNNRENNPNAALLITALRSLGYNNISAINDIIDNAVDAHATNIHLDISLDDPTNDLIRITDNGDGMDEHTLDQALRLGSNTNHDISSDLGKFGMGLSTASISIAKRLVVLTKTQESDTVLAATQDIDAITTTNAFVKTQGAADLEQQAVFHKLLPKGHGTIIFLNKCDRITNRKSLANKLAKEISRVFREHLNSSISIYVNKEQLVPTDIFFQHEGGTIYSDETYPVTVTKNGKAYTDTIRVRLGILPDYGQKGNQDRGINATNQGFYVIRNNREIQKGATLGLFTRHPSFNRFRAEIYFSAELDEALGVNFQKNGVNLTQAVFDKLHQNIEPQLRTIRKRCAKSVTQASTVDTHKESTRQITKKSALLDTPAPNGLPRYSSSLSPNQPPVEFGTYNGGKGDDIYEAEMQGKTVHVNWNRSHPFYEQIVQASQENKDVAIGLDLLVYSMAIAELKLSNPETLDLIAEFKTQFSFSLNTLLR